MNDNFMIEIFALIIISVCMIFITYIITYIITENDTQRNIKQHLCKHLYSQSVNYINCNSRLLDKVIEEVKYIDGEE